MELELITKQLDGIVVVRPEIARDSRGFFLESFRADKFEAIGLPTHYVQDNHSRSVKGTIRGLHFQWDPKMAKLMRVTIGSAFLVAVDIRKGSPTLGRWYGVEVSAENRLQMYAPPGFARGFCALTDVVELQYKCTGIYNSKGESAILWNDPRIGIEWPVKDPILSEKDAKAQTFDQWLASPLADHFTYEE